MAAGGTAGHVTPALAIADAYRKRVPDAEILFLGTAGGSEATLVPARGYPLHTLSAEPFFGVPWWRRGRALSAAFTGTLAARRWLRDEGVELLLSFGGYASAGAILGARSLGLPIVLHELNALAGVTHRLLGPLADRVLLGFESAGSAFRGDRISLVGVPVSERALAGRPAAPPAGRSMRVLVSGGTLGSNFLDEHVPELLARVVTRGCAVEVKHQVGRGDEAATRARYAQAGVPSEVFPSTDDMIALLAWADFAVVHGGAATLAELAAMGVPALVVPLGTAALDHQAANARAFHQATGAGWTRERDWEPEPLARGIAALAESPDAWLAAADGVRRAARPKAALDAVEACEALLREPGRSVAWAAR